MIVPSRTERLCDLVISLGSNCALTYNLRLYYGVDSTGLFDWTITPLGALPNLIRRRFNFVDNSFASELQKINANGMDDIVHDSSGILLHHEFPRDDNGTIVNQWREHISAVAAKFKFLGGRMNSWFAASHRPALFINGTGSYEGLDDQLAASTHSPDILKEIIGAFRTTYPQTDPTFCILNGHPPSLQTIETDDHVKVVASVANHGDWHEGFVNHYAGCRRGWAEALDGLHIGYVAGDAEKLGYRIKKAGGNRLSLLQGNKGTIHSASS